MKVLVAEDTPTNLLVLEGMLRKEGYEVVSASDGAEALQVFEREQPEMVIMDVMMPVMDGYEATRRIKERSGDRFIPVIFLTAMTDEASLARCVECGGDDFLTKPFNRVLLKAKIDALNRIRKLYDLVKSQNQELALHNERLEGEQEMAGAVLERLLDSGCLDSHSIRYRLIPAGMMSGDLVLAADTPAGALHLLLGDLTGHGLSAAIGAVPTAEVFYRMTAAGYGPKWILAEINRRLKEVLPPNQFCCVAFVELDPIDNKLSVWNAGLPDVLLYGPGRGIHRRYPSEHPPLGILGPTDFTPVMNVQNLDPDDRIYLYTDGLIEAVDSNGTMFAQDRLEQYFADAKDPHALFGEIEAALVAFMAGAKQMDDVALVELTGNLVSRSQRAPIDASPSVPHTNLTWRVSLEMGPAFLKQVDPLPELMRMLAWVDPLTTEKATLFLIASELFSNSLEHGLLRLDSSLKQSPDGFATYYNLREQRLADMKDGSITIQLKYSPHGDGGKLVFRIQDSGQGFDFIKSDKALGMNNGYSGRGITLLRSLCQDLTYQGNGNTVEAVFVW